MQQVDQPSSSSTISSVSLFTNGIRSTTPTKSITLQQLYRRITLNRYAAKTAALRALPIDSPRRKQLKLQLDSVTPAGVFTKRCNEGLKARSGLLVLDFDDVPNPTLLSKLLRRDRTLGPSVMLECISQSQVGLKVLVAVDLGIAHERSYEAIANYLASKRPKWFQWLDKAGKDVSRACLLCHDPQAYLNPNHRTPTPFVVSSDLSELFDERKSPFPSYLTAEEEALCIEPWVAAVETAGTFPDDYPTWYQVGFAFASLGEAGRELFHRVSRISLKYEAGECDQQFDVSLKKSRGKVKLGTFIHFCKEAGLLPNPNAPAVAVEAGDPPPIPGLLYARLPRFLQECCAPFESERERDVMLLGLLTVLSGCFPGVGGVYRRRTYGLNLFTFIIAPAASGKGTLAWAQFLVLPWHKRQLEKSAATFAEYQAAQNNDKAKEGTIGSPPPRRVTLFLPANSTSAAILTQLAENGGHGIIFETEADTLSGALGADFGNFSDLLRKAFEHEPVSVLRKLDRQYIDLERPALSMALTGTPGQVPRLLKSAEDGLVSRILFYTFTQPPVWQDVSPNAGPALDGYFAPLAAELLRFIEAVPPPTDADPYPVQITLSKTDWARLNTAGREGLTEAHVAAGDAGTSTALRLGPMAWRIIGILTVMRCQDNGEVPSGSIEAHPDDVNSALAIMDTVRPHGLTVLDALPKSEVNKRNSYSLKATKMEQAQALRLQGVSIRKIAEQINEAKSTVQAWVK
jgi:hypothetical protein